MAVKSGYKQTEVGVIPEEWDARRVCEFASVITGGTPRTEVQAYWDGDYPWVTPTDITDQRDMWASERMISESGLGSIRQLPANAVLVTCIASIGKNAILRSVGGCNQQINAVVPKQENSPEFLYYTFESSKQYLLANAGMTATRILSKAAFEQLKFSIPPLPEQHAIAKALSDVDGLLGGLDRLIAKKRDLKQAAMQQLLTGQTRLPGFHGEWEVKQLGRVLRFQVGFPFSSAFFNEKGQGIRLIKNRDLKCDDQVFYYSGAYDSAYLVKDGDVLVGMDGDFLPCLWSKGTALLNQRVGRIVPTVGLNLQFVYYYLLEPLKEIEIATASTTVKHLSHGDIESIEQPLPSLPEQTAIAEGLTAMDAELTALEQRREKTRALKQAMMQELLTGRTRLV